MILAIGKSTAMETIDVKTTITHPATTTHGRLTPEARAAAGIGEGLIRLAVGLESPADLQADLARGLG